MPGTGRRFFVNVTSIDLAGMAVAAVLTVALVFGVLVPLGTRERQNTGRQEAAARQKQRLNALVATANALKMDVDKTQRLIAASPLNLRPQSALNDRLASIVALSNECGLAVEDMKPGEGVRVRRFMMVPLRMKGRGGYVQSVDFLRRLHEQTPDVGVSAFQLSGSADAGGSGSAFDFELRWLALPQTAGTPAVAILPQ